MESRAVTATEDDVEVVDTDAGGPDAFAAYFAEANKACDREVVPLWPLALMLHL